MIPLRDDNPTRRLPVICITLIALNILVFLLDQSQRVLVYDVVQTSRGARQVGHLVGGLSLHYSLIPALVSGRAQAGSDLYAAPWLTVFSSMFLHANWLHLGGNMLYLWIFGNNIEDILGRPRFLLFYLLCGVGAAACHIATDPTSTIPTVGASGAIAGVMGGYLLLYPGAKVLTLVPIFFFGMFLDFPAVVIIVYWFVLQVINAQWLGSGGMLQRGGGVAYMAHIGGFLTGMLLILLLGGRRLLPPPESRGFDEDYNERRWRRDPPN